MNDFPLLRIGILLTVIAAVGFGLYAAFADGFGDWLKISKDEDGYRLQVDIGNEELDIITVNGQNLFVEIADTPEKTSKGLGGHAPLGPNEGMLFVFNDTRIHAFWMKGMTFDLDIIWIRDGEVVEIARNMPAPSGAGIPATYRPGEAANMVLEINAGRARDLGIDIGTKIEGLPEY